MQHREHRPLRVQGITPGAMSIEPR